MLDGDPAEAPIGLKDGGGRLPARYLRSTASNYVYNGVSLVLAIVMTPVLVHYLGKEEYGVWVLASSLIMYLDLFQFGFAQSTITYFARANASGDRDTIRRIASTAFSMLTLAGAAAFCIAGVLALVVPGQLDLDPAQVTAMRALMIISAAAFTMSIPNDVFGSLLNGLQRYDLVFGSLSCVLILQAMSAVIVLWAGGGLVELGAASAVITLAGQLSRWWMANRLIGHLRPRRRTFDRSLVRPLASLSAWFSLRDISLLLIERIDTVIVGFVVGVPAAAVYSVGQRMVTFIGRFVRPLSTALLPFSAELSERGEHDRARDTVIAGSRLSLAVGLPLCLTFALFARPLIHTWVGGGFGDAALVVVYLSLAEAMGALVETSSSVLRGRGDAKPVAIGGIAEAVLNLVLSLVLAHTMGIAGVALATLIARTTIQVGVFLPYALRRLGIARLRFLGDAVSTQAPAFVAALAVGLLARSWATSGELVRLGAGCAATVGVYLVVLAFTGLSDAERRRLMQALPFLRPSSS